MRIRDFTDWHPVPSGIIIALLFTVVPGVFMLAADIISGGAFNSALVVVIYAFALQFILWLYVERMSLVWEPFAILLIGFVIAEVIYTVSIGSSDPTSAFCLMCSLISTAIIDVLGAEAGGIVGALLVYLIFIGIRKLVNTARGR